MVPLKSILYKGVSMERTASAVWEGGLKSGNGSISTESKAVIRMHYSHRTRFENEAGTNPEELIGAAHAGCFSMYLAGKLEEQGFSPEKLETTAKVTLEPRPEGPVISAVHLHLSAKVPGIDATAFEEAAQQAKEECPVSRLLTARISLDTELNNSGERVAS
jgi:lipoyl-dependent peroxiredoxin